jgi:hypothetical protein
MTRPSDHPAEDRGPDGELPGPPEPSQTPRIYPDCELLDSVAAELALGSLTGAERSAALAHLDDCQACRQLVEELTAAADALLLIAPEADPPAGFEVRLLDRLKAAGASAVATSPARGDRSVAATAAGDRAEGPAEVVPIGAGPARSHRRFSARARVVLSAAAVAIAAAGVGLGFGVAPRTAPAVSASGQLRVASLHPGNGATGSPAAGEVVVTNGRPSWILMSVDLRATGWVTCEVEVNGRYVPIGTFSLYRGEGSWAARIQQTGAAVTSARVIDPSGQVLASAVFQS